MEKYTYIYFLSVQKMVKPRHQTLWHESCLLPLYDVTRRFCYPENNFHLDCESFQSRCESVYLSFPRENQLHSFSFPMAVTLGWPVFTSNAFLSPACQLASAVPLSSLPEDCSTHSLLSLVTVAFYDRAQQSTTFSECVFHEYALREHTFCTTSRQSNCLWVQLQ